MPKDGLISTYFTLKAPGRADESDGVQKSPAPESSRKRVDSSTEDENRARKQPRIEVTSSVSGKDENNSKELLHQWKYDHSSALRLRNDESLDRLSQSQRTKEQEVRHAAFSARLLGSIERRDKREQEKQRDVMDVQAEDGDGEEDDDVEEVEPNKAIAQFAASAPSKGRARATKETLSADNIKYTPLEKQYLELRKAYPDVLLCIEVGYKFKFYGDDARVASRELNIAYFMEKHLMTAMVPLHRLQLHIKKLVLAGYKVGVVRQTETRALKAASSNASKPFTRELTELYTASTWIDDMLASEMGESNSSSPRSLVAIVEQAEGETSGADERVSIGLIAVQTATGTITFDQFNDTTMRSELETRLAHLEPTEMILPGTTSKQTSRLLQYIAGQTSHSPSSVRIETTDKAPSYNEAYSSVSDFYSKGEFVRDLEASQVDASKKILSVVVAMPALALIALAVAIEHLKTFHLESVFQLATNFTSFSSRHEMLLTSNTLSNLEILENNTDFKEKGSLIWMLSGGCTTSMGKRLLRRWLTRPLTDIDKLRDRSNAVESFLKERHVAAKTSSLLKGLPDLERGLARLLYHRAAPSELATILLSLNRVTTEFEPNQYPNSLGSTLLDEAIATLPLARKVVQESLAVISTSQARENNKRDLFVDVDRYEYVQDTKDLLSVVDCDMHEHLLELRKIIKNPRLQYASVAGEDYLIEVIKDTRLSIPADWLRISSTKKVTRYRSPLVMKLMKQRAQLQETLDAQADEAYRSFVRELCDQHYSLLRDVVTSLSTLDALLSLSVLASLPGYSKVKFAQEGNCIELRGFRHPMTEALHETTYIDNDISLGDKSEDKVKGILLTGSNMGGKSSTVRAIALIIIMAQVGSYVPATHALVSLHDAVLTRMGASDQLAKGRSTFMVEVQETAEIMRAATDRSLVILDELGRGTSTYDGQAIAEAVLQHLLERELHRRPILFFITHFLSLGRMMATLPLRGMHMAYIDRGGSNISFLYKIRKGLAEKSFGIHCAQMANLPKSLLELASFKAKELEETTTTRSSQRRVTRVIQAARLLFSDSSSWTERQVNQLHTAASVFGPSM